MNETVDKNKRVMHNKIIKLKNLLLSTQSAEYQRMLSGVRVYFSLMSQNGFFSLLLFGIFLTSFVTVLLGIIENTKDISGCGQIYLFSKIPKMF